MNREMNIILYLFEPNILLEPTLITFVITFMITFMITFVPRWQLKSLGVNPVAIINA